MKFLGLVKNEILQQQNSTKIKAYFQKLKAAPQYHRVLEWGKLISVTGAAQIFVQVVGFISGILVIRFLPVEEYALYTLANAFLGTIAILGDGGISAGVLSQGGKEWQNKKKLGAIVATGLQMRKKFALYSLSFGLPILSFLLLENGASWLTVFLIIITLIPAFYADLSDSLWDIVPKLHQAIPALQKNQLAVGFGRLLLTVSLVFIFPFTFMTLIAYGIPRIFGNHKLKIIAAPYITLQKPDNYVKKEIYKTVKRILPGAIYFCLSGQITIWILSILGNTSGLAQLGALAKFGVAFSIIGTMVSILIVPRFARQKEKKSLLFKYYLQIISAVFVLLTGATLIISIFPDQILWILGENYTNLETELLYVVIGAGLGILCGVMVSLHMSRNWIINPILSISISALSIVAGVFLFEVSELKGVLLLNIFLIIIQVGIHGTYGFYRMKNLKELE
jgi:O-antigen/teichoic acid export membrane protein